MQKQKQLLRFTFADSRSKKKKRQKSMIKLEVSINWSLLQNVIQLYQNNIPGKTPEPTKRFMLCWYNFQVHAMSKLVPFTYALAIYRHSRTPLKVLKQFQLSSNKLFRKKLLRNLQNLLVVPYKPFNSCSFQGPAKYEDFNSSF